MTDRAIPDLPSFELGYVGTDLRRRLVELVLRGQKIATAGLAENHAPYTDEPMPKAGDRWILRGYDDEPVAVVETTSASVVPASQVTLQFAQDEGEGFESVAHWREAHERFWSEHQITDETLILCEYFRVVERISDG